MLALQNKALFSDPLLALGFRCTAPGAAELLNLALQLSNSALLCSRWKLLARRPPPSPASQKAHETRNFCLVQPPLHRQNSRTSHYEQTQTPNAPEGVSKRLPFCNCIQRPTLPCDVANGRGAAHAVSTCCLHPLYRFRAFGMSSHGESESLHQTFALEFRAAKTPCIAEQPRKVAELLAFMRKVSSM